MEIINKNLKKLNLKKYFNFIVIILFFAVVGFFLNQNYDFSQKKVDNEIGKVEIAGKIIKVEIADTAELQERGLSGRENLKNDEGMLFIFSKSSRNYFWMKEMNFPIDIVWLVPSEAGIDETFKVIYIKENVLPSSYPESFGPNVDSKYVLEVNSGFSEKNNLKVGEIVKFLP
jgi:uncharacterized membrane protein (UPF0127 family)